MKKLLKTIIVLIILFFGLLTLYKLYKENDTMIAIVEYFTRENSKIENNTWQINNQNRYVNITNEYTPKNKDDLLDIYYTILASGMNEFVFYCDMDYKECINDVKELTKDDMILSHVNGLVHVYNSYNTISTEFKNNGKVFIIINRLYTKEQIDKIDKEVSRIFDNIYNEKKSIKENLRLIHDYIINNTKYDLAYVDKTTDRLSNTAYAPLFDGYAICSGYTDLMSLFLYKMNIPNIRVSNETHTWNMLYLENENLIIDLTYDDPVTSDKSDYIRHDYFLITSDKLQQLDDDHYYNKDIYLK